VILVRKPVNLEEARRRREAKIRQKKQRQALLVFLVLGGLLGLIFIFQAIVNSSFWQIKEVKIQGNSKISRAVILKKLNLNKEQNLLKAPVSLMKARLSQEPYVEEVIIDRLLPNKLLITVKERKPFLNLKQGQAYFLIDKNGYVLEKKPQAISNLPVALDFKFKAKLGQQIKSKKIKEVLLVLKRLDNKLRAKIAWVSLPAAARITFHTQDNLEIIYGDASEYRKKNFVLNKVLKEESKDNIVYINVAIPKIPVVKRVRQ